MANEIESLSRRQEEATRELERLTAELRRSRTAAGEQRFSDLGGIRAGTGASETESVGAAKRTEESPSVGGRSDDAARAVSATVEALGDLDRRLAENIESLGRSTSTFGDGLRGVLSELGGGLSGGSGVGSFFRSGLGLAPLGLGIARLFGGGGREESPDPLQLFEPSAALNLGLANSQDGRGSFREVVRGQRDEPRVGAQVRLQPSVVVNVDALDARSFMDRSGEVASAVRDAMLHMHSVNDLVEEL